MCSNQNQVYHIHKGMLAMPKFIVYSGDNEVIITVASEEAQVREEYFGENIGRDFADYERVEIDQPSVWIQNRINTHVS